MTVREKLLAQLLKEIDVMTTADLPAFKAGAVAFHKAVQGKAFVNEVYIPVIAPAVQYNGRNIVFDNKIPETFSYAGGSYPWTESNKMAA